MPAVLDPLRIERESNTADLSVIVDGLVNVLGKQATAYVAGLKDVKMVNKWLAGGDTTRTTRLRLRHAYTAARMIETAFDVDTVEAWFFASNSKLDDDAPAWVLRNAQSLDDLRFVVPAAKAFARASE